MGHPTLPGRLRPGTPDPDIALAHDPSCLMECVRGHGGTLAHVLGALGTFRSRHGHWPRRLYLYPETLAALVQDLTPLGFYRCQQRLDILADLERDLFCADESGNVSIYRIQATVDPVGIDAAAVWLGLAPPMVGNAHGPDDTPRSLATPKPPR